MSKKSPHVSKSETTKFQENTNRTAEVPLTKTNENVLRQLAASQSGSQEETSVESQVEPQVGSQVEPQAVPQEDASSGIDRESSAPVLNSNTSAFPNSPSVGINYVPNPSAPMTYYNLMGFQNIHSMPPFMGPSMYSNSFRNPEPPPLLQPHLMGSQPFTIYSRAQNNVSSGLNPPLIGVATNPAPQNLQPPVNSDQPSAAEDNSLTINKLHGSQNDTAYKLAKPGFLFQDYSNKFNAKSSKDLHMRPYSCSFPNCEWAFTRQSDLRRHARSHSKPMFNCPYWKNDPTCHRNGGAFNRLDVLKRHLKLVHYVQETPHNPTSRSRHDPGWCKICQKMFPNSKAFIDHCYECSQHTVLHNWSLNPKDKFESKSNGLSEEAISLDNERTAIAAAALYDLPKINDDKDNYFLDDNDDSTTSDTEEVKTKSLEETTESMIPK